MSTSRFAASLYRSTVSPDRTLTIILRAASVLGLVAAILNPLMNTGETGERKLFESVSVGVVSALVYVVSLLISVSARVTPDAVVLRCAWIFAATVPLDAIERIAADRTFGNAGFGYRLLGKNHRGFIMGGPQVTLFLHDSWQYTVSVESVEEFSAAVNRAKG